MFLLAIISLCKFLHNGKYYNFLKSVDERVLFCWYYSHIIMGDRSSSLCRKFLERLKFRHVSGSISARINSYDERMKRYIIVLH